MTDYYEAIENVSDEYTEPDFIRFDITGMTEPEKAEVLGLIQEQFAGMSYSLFLHHCGHSVRQSCYIEII